MNNINSLVYISDNNDNNLGIKNNKSRRFGGWDDFHNKYAGELTDIEFEIQYTEFVAGVRELDRFLIRAMFKNNMDITSLDLINVINLSLVFAKLDNMAQDISRWNVSNITNMSHMFYKTLNFTQYLGNWVFNSKCSKPNIHLKSFDKHNNFYKFSKERLQYFLDLYNNSTGLDKDQKKYEAILYIKQFREFDLEKFNSIINELKSKSNSGKEFFDEIS
jgi:surface protein